MRVPYILAPTHRQANQARKMFKDFVAAKYLHSSEHLRGLDPNKCIFLVVLPEEMTHSLIEAVYRTKERGAIVMMAWY